MSTWTSSKIAARLFNGKKIGGQDRDVGKKVE